MSALYAKMFKEKKKRPVDPNAPPRPNLMSQAKELRTVNERLEMLYAQLQQQQEEIQQLKSKLYQSNYRVEQLTTYLKNAKRY